MNGLWIKDNESFATLLEPLLPHFEPLWWYGDFTNSPVLSSLESEDEELWHEYENCFLPTKLFENRSGFIWKPHTLPKFASRIFCGEWSYLTGFAASEDSVEFIISEFLAMDDFTEAPFFSLVEKRADIYIVSIDESLFHVYSPHDCWLQKLHEKWSTSEFIEPVAWWKNWNAQLQAQLNRSIKTEI